MTTASASEIYLGRVRRFFFERKRMPSYGELTRLLGFRSKNAALYQARKWIERGMIRRDRQGRLLPGPRFQEIRIMGAIQAGFPSPAEEEMLDTLSLDEWLIENREASFLVRVGGDSMKDAGIHAGDLVIFERGRTPQPNDIVIAEIDHEWTLKYFERKPDGRVILRAANPAYPILEPKEELKIIGVVRTVIRKY